MENHLPRPGVWKLILGATQVIASRWQSSLRVGREAISEYKTVESFANHTLLEFHPLTGRTHQIRLHCAFLGCPIVGDEIYGRKKRSLEISRHFLHAFRLKIVLPGETETRNFEAPLPEELEHVLTSLRAAR